MRIRVLSDLHLEAAPFDPPAAPADVVVLAGDIDNGAAGVEWAKARFAAPVLYVAGNHEPYDGEFHATQAALREAATGTRVQVLDCSETVIGGVRFLGCTLWTDFALAGEAGRKLAIEKYWAWLIDYRTIRWHDRPFSVDDSTGLHAAHRAWLARRLLHPFAGVTVVITHHVPHPGSIAPKFVDHPLNPAFVSNLEHLMGRARLWIHGHTHRAFDYTVRGTRVVCNPRGYADEDTGFSADLVVEV
ncbi:MAG TPA: metallophosphoesterase [Burkholderiales bacterium]|nr:metallophosphoesterase [Burkholderiales bacterium]